jgi:PPK2 family polyphosphate:nucleotide phosphotransferase
MKKRELYERLVVKPGEKAKLSKRDSDDTAGFKKKAEVRALLDENVVRLDELQYLLYAENKRALLVVLQAMDAGGKDGTIRHVMGALNPQGVRVTSFKKPSDEEREHDFLWRINKAVPRYGNIGIFNRSHYEDVLVVRIHDLVKKSVWSKRYKQINDFERHLADNNVTILKFFLHISKDEQKERFQARLDDPSKHWKASPADFAERKYWDDYQEAFEDALSNCSTKHAPWFVIPANKKWFRNFAVSQIIRDTLESLDMKFPPAPLDLDKVKIV